MVEVKEPKKSSICWVDEVDATLEDDRNGNGNGSEEGHDYYALDQVRFEGDDCFPRQNIEAVNVVRTSNDGVDADVDVEAGDGWNGKDCRSRKLHNDGEKKDERV